MSRDGGMWYKLGRLIFLRIVGVHLKIGMGSPKQLSFWAQAFQGSTKDSHKIATTKSATRDFSPV